jgi:hypothetical protein
MTDVDVRRPQPVTLWPPGSMHLYVPLVAVGVALLATTRAALGSDPDSQRTAKEPIVSRPKVLLITVYRLRRQEELVRACESVVSYQYVATDPAMIPLIEAYCWKIGAEPKAAIWTKETVAKNSRAIHCWRKGVKERVETFDRLDDLQGGKAAPRSIAAFDGTVARSYAFDGPGGQAVAFVTRARTWLTRPSQDPFELIYEYGHRRLSDLVDRSSDVRITDADGQTTVSFKIPDLSPQRMVLVLNRDGLIVRRDILGLSHPREKPTSVHIVARQSYSYRTYRNESGESVVFPALVQSSHVLGTTDDGTLIITNREQIEVHSFKFNQPISDEMFALKFPKNANIIDRR